MGVPVIGTAQDFLPSLPQERLAYGVDYAAGDEADIAKLIHTKQELACMAAC